MPTITVEVTRHAVGSLVGKLGCCSASESTTITVQAATTVTKRTTVTASYKKATGIIRSETYLGVGG